MRNEEGRRMKDIIVRLNINYEQYYEPSRSRNGRVLAIGLSYRSDLAVREVDPQAAPVAYRVRSMTGLLPQCSERVEEYEIRSFDGALFWPLVGDQGFLSVSTFLDLAAAGHRTARMTFDPDAWRSHSELSTADVYFERHKPRKLLETNQAELWMRAVRGSRGVIFCGGFVYVEAGEPVWFAEESVDIDGLDLRIGCASLDRAGSIFHDVPGPYKGARSGCASQGWAFGLDELENEMCALRLQTAVLQVHSDIKVLAALHSADTGALLCERELARSLWYSIQSRESWSLALEESLPALARSHVRSSIEDLNCREVVAQLAALEAGDDTESDDFIMTARNIRKRLASLGVSLHAEEDDDAFAELAGRLQ
jgi:hypothetical protein